MSNLNVRIGSSSQVHGGQIFALQNLHGQQGGREVVLNLGQEMSLAKQGKLPNHFVVNLSQLFLLLLALSAQLFPGLHL